MKLSLSPWTTPLMIDGVLYATAGVRRAVVAIDPGSGETLWTWSMDEGERLERLRREVKRLRIEREVLKNGSVGWGRHL